MPATDFLAPDEFADLLDAPEFKTLRPAQRAAVFDAGLKDSEEWLRENNALDQQIWQQTAMALGNRYRPAEADIELDQQGPIGTAVNAFKNLGPDVVQGVVGGVAKMADAASEMVGLSDPNVPSWMDKTADFTEKIQQEGQIIRPLNPANPTAATIGSGAGQAVAMLGTAGASLPVLGARAMTAVPAAMGFAMGAGQGIDTAEEMGITSPAARLGMGTAFGAIEGVTEMLGGIGGKFIPPMRGLPGAAANIATETLEEPLAGSLQDLTTAGVGQFMSDPNRPGFTPSGYELPAFNAAMLERRKQEAIGGAAGGMVFAGLQALSPNDRLSPNQTPAPSGTPQATGTTPGTAPLAGAAGPVPSTLSRIAQESLVPDLPEFTGELTAEDVQDLEGVGQSMSDPSTLQVGGAASPMPGAFRVTGEGSTPSPATSPTASVTEESSVTADQTAQPTPGAGLSPAAGSFSPAERSPEAQAYAQAVAQAAEEARQAQIARLRMIDNKAQGMPLIPDSPRGDRDILDFANENPIYLPPGFSEERNLPEYEKLKEAKLPAYWRQFVASSKRGGNPEQVAQRAYDAGLISEPDAGLYLDAVREGIDSRKQYRVDFAAREKALETEEKQVIDFEKTQQTLRRKDKERVRFEDIAPGDEMTIDGEQAVVKHIEYTEDGYLTNVVIEDGKRFGLMQFDPQTRSGLFVDEYTPKQREQTGAAEEPLFSRAAPRMDFSGLMQNTQAVASGAQAPQRSPALAGMIAAPTPGARPAAPTPGNGGARGVKRFFQSSPSLPVSESQSLLPSAYREATRGSSTQMAPLSSVYAQARLLQPGLTPDAFLAQVQEGYNNGTLFLEGAGSQQEAAQAGLSLPGTNVGTAIRMMPAPQAEAPLRNAAGRATNAAMASTDGAAQNAEPSPGGLSEAEDIEDNAPGVFRLFNAIMASSDPGSKFTDAVSIQRPGSRVAGFFLGASKEAIKGYGNVMKELAVTITKPLVLSRETYTPMAFYELMSKEANVTLDADDLNGLEKEPVYTFFSPGMAANPFDSRDLARQLVANGYDAVVMFDDSAYEAQRKRPTVWIPYQKADNIEVVQSFETSRAAGGTSGNPATSIQQPAPALASRSELAANQKANETILKNLGLPTQKGTRVWGAAKVKTALAKLSTDERYPATTRLMARELSNLSLNNLLLKIEADARLNWAGLYQPFTDGRGELSLNTRTMGRGEQDIGISLVHEALHHATYRALRAPKTARQKQAKADLEALFSRARAALAANEQFSKFDYELSSVDEFITGLWTRADFQTALAGIPLENAPTLGQRVRSMLDEIFRVLAELVTGKQVPTGSVLEASMAATLRIMGDGKPSLQSQLKNAVMTQGTGPITIRPPSLRGIKAYHGTPHKVDKFTTAKIGTGEGAQAYGWGLYFAQGKAVAEEYRKNLTNPTEAPLLDGQKLDNKNPAWHQLSNVELAGIQQLAKFDGDKAKAIESVYAQADEYGIDRSNPSVAGRVESINKYSGRVRNGYTQGNLYTVELLPDEDEFLDWDKPLAEQSADIRDILVENGIDETSVKELLGSDSIGMSGVNGSGRGSDIYAYFGYEENTFGEVSFSAEIASRRLAELGIPGIRYLDAGSRGAGDGSRNFVVFDDKHIRITEANGQPVAGWDNGPELPALQNPAAAEQRENRSAFARPEQEQRMYEVQGNDVMQTEAAQWLAGVDNATAVQQLESGLPPTGLRKDHLPALAEQTMQRLVQTMASDKELVRLQAEALLDRAGIAWQDVINREAGRGLQQVGAANARLLPIAPILATKRILVQRAEVVMDKRFEGGAEGAVEKVKVIIQKADTQASQEVAQAVQDTVEMAPPVDPAAARAAVNAITQTARTYFGGTLPPRVKILHQEQAEWDARMNGNVLELNAAALETSQVVGKIEHEIGHLLFQDPAMRQQFDALWNSLDVNERATIENITAALYDAANRNEEASVRALDTVRQMVEAKNPGLWQRFVTWLRQAWERLTGRLPRDPRRLAAVMIETGVARLKGMEGNQTEVRESRRSDLLKVNSPQLAKLLNSLRTKVAPGMKWADIFTEMPAAQLERQREIYKRLMQHKALVKLSANERLQLTNELDKAWQRARKKVFDKELDKAGVLGEKDASDRKKAKAVLPKMLRMINLGMFDSAAWRDAVAPQYGLRMLTSADTAQLRTLAEAAWKLPEGVIRNQKLRDLLNAIQKKTGASWIEVLNSYWTAAVLSGLRTQFDTWLAAVNGMGTNLMQIGGLVARGQGRAAIDAHAQWWRGLFEGVRESGQILFKGDTSYLKRFGADLKKALEGETSVTPVPLGENLWQNGNTFQKYGLAPVMMFTGRLMAAADHINNTATTQGAIAVARALHPELYQGKVGFTETERAEARTQALREVTGGNEPKTPQERATVSARTREILNGTVKPADYAAATEIGDMAAYQNDPTGLFGVVYSAMKQGLGSIQRGLGDYAEDVTANRFTRVISGVMAGSLHGITGTRFMRFGANFGADLTRYIPGSYVLGKAGFYGRDVSRMQQELLLGKNLVGLMLASTLAAVFLNSDDEDEGWQIEGDWSTLNPQQAKERMAAGYERLTMWKRENGQVRRVSYKQWPTMGLFAVVGGMLDEKRHKPASWAAHGAAGHLLRGVATGYTQIKNVSAVRNLVELFGEPTFSADAVSGTIDKMVKIGTNFAGGFMPTLIKDAETWTDPRHFKPEGTAELMLRSMPIARKFVNDGRPQLNLLGEEVKLQRAPWSRAYTSVESAEAHRVLGALLARGLALPMPSDQIHVFKNGVKMPLETLGKEAVWKYEKAVGTGYKQWLSTEGRDLLQMPVEEADKTIQRRAKEIKNTAKAAVVR